MDSNHEPERIIKKCFVDTDKNIDRIERIQTDFSLMRFKCMSRVKPDLDAKEYAQIANDFLDETQSFKELFNQQIDVLIETAKSTAVTLEEVSNEG